MKRFCILSNHLNDWWYPGNHRRIICGINGSPNIILLKVKRRM